VQLIGWFNQLRRWDGDVEIELCSWVGGKIIVACDATGWVGCAVMRDTRWGVAGGMVG
jgi:formylmethanofuran dehydrogenase subunit C